jgi:hypothetical protein
LNLFGSGFGVICPWEEREMKSQCQISPCL